jgi:hypothetical protein
MVLDAIDGRHAEKGKVDEVPVNPDVFIEVNIVHKKTGLEFSVNVNRWSYTKVFVNVGKCWFFILIAGRCHKKRKAGLKSSLVCKSNIL